MSDPVEVSLATDDRMLERSWAKLQDSLGPRFGNSLGIEGILFLIGVQEQGRGFQPKLRKEKKQDLIMLGTHCVLEAVGVYDRVSEQDHKLHFQRRTGLPHLSIDEQEKLLRVGIIRYFSGAGLESVR